jgi:hypothetical protein
MQLNKWHLIGVATLATLAVLSFPARFGHSLFRESGTPASAAASTVFNFQTAMGEDGFLLIRGNLADLESLYADAAMSVPINDAKYACTQPNCIVNNKDPTTGALVRFTSCVPDREHVSDCFALCRRRRPVHWLHHMVRLEGRLRRGLRQADRDGRPARRVADRVHDRQDAQAVAGSVAHLRHVQQLHHRRRATLPGGAGDVRAGRAGGRHAVRMVP